MRRATSLAVALVLAVLWLAAPQPAEAQRAGCSLCSPHGTNWVMVASRPGESAARRFAQSFSRTVSPAMVVRTNNGRYAIIAGYLESARAEGRLRSLKRLQVIPPDAVLMDDGSSIRRLVYSQGGLPGDLMRARALRSTIARMQRGMRDMGVYRSTIDGLAGPNTAGAFDAYRRRFGVPFIRNERQWRPGMAVATLEGHAGSSSRLAQQREAEREAERRAERERERRRAEERRLADAREADRRAREEAQRQARLAEEREAERLAAEREAERRAAERLAAQREAERLAGDLRRDGWRSEEERREGRTAGFSDGDAYRSAKAGGFRNRSEYDAARRMEFAQAAAWRAFQTAGWKNRAEQRVGESRGFDTRDVMMATLRAGFQTLDARNAAREAGFDTADAWNAAQKGGFESHVELRDAQNMGFASKAEVAAYQASGFASAEQFRKASARGWKRLEDALAGLGEEIAGEARRAEGLVKEVTLMLGSPGSLPNVHEFATGIFALDTIRKTSVDGRDFDALEKHLATLREARAGLRRRLHATPEYRERITKLVTERRTQLQGNLNSLGLWALLRLNDEELQEQARAVAKLVDGVTPDKLDTLDALEAVMQRMDEGLQELGLNETIEDYLPLGADR